MARTQTLADARKLTHTHTRYTPTIEGEEKDEEEEEEEGLFVTEKEIERKRREMIEEKCSVARDLLAMANVISFEFIFFSNDDIATKGERRSNRLF